MKSWSSLVWSKPGGILTMWWNQTHILQHEDALWWPLPWMPVCSDLEKATRVYSVPQQIRLTSLMTDITWWYCSTNLLRCIVDMTNKRHALNNPLAKAKDRCPHPRWHKDSDQKYESNRCDEAKTCGIIRVQTENLSWIKNKMFFSLMTSYHITIILPKWLAG